MLDGCLDPHTVAMAPAPGTKLGLEREPVSTQVIPRDRHAELLMVLALCGSSIERIAGASDSARYQRKDALVSLWETRVLQGKVSFADFHRTVRVTE